MGTSCPRQNHRGRPSGVIFGSRDEVLTFCDYAAINTDDNAYIEFSAPKDLIGFEAYQDYLPRFYDPEWDKGNMDSLIEEFGGNNVEKSENYEQCQRQAWVGESVRRACGICHEQIDQQHGQGKTRGETWAAQLGGRIRRVSAEHVPCARREPR